MPTLNFKGKTFVQNHHLAVKYHQLVPKSELSLTDTVSLHDNLILHGDNLKALKALLPNYAGKVKCIYIDPPYNTGNENWVYNDNVSNPMIKEWLGSVVDKEDMTRHDKWLCMMTPRLKLLRELLSEDGVIFISIDDNEQHNLRVLMDEIFGEDNFVGLMTIQSNPRGSQSSKNLSSVHEYILMYAKNESEMQLKGVSKEEGSIEAYTEMEENGRKYRFLGLRQRGGAWRMEQREKMHYPIFVNPNNGTVSLNKDEDYSIEVIPQRPTGELGRWTWGKEKLEANKHLIVGKPINRTGQVDVWDVFRKDYFDDDDGNEKTAKIKTMWIEKEINYQNAKNEIKDLFDNSEIFDYPKPTYIVKRLLSMLYTNEQDIVLDSFAGSGTTAHAVLELNKEDGGNRQFILVEQEDYANTITAERVRRVIKKMSEPLISIDSDDSTDSSKKILKNKTKSSVQNHTNQENQDKSTVQTFSYFELGAAIEMEAILTQNALPSYLEFARYLFYTATGEQFNEKVMNEETGFIGESRNYEVYLFYQPDIEWLKQNALTLDRCRSFPKHKSKRRLVFAPAKYVDDDTCNEHRIVFCQLPYEIYRLNH